MTSAYPYISPSEYADYGISDATPAQVDAATRIVNNYLGRPEGVLWVPDAFGFPCFMAWKQPTLSANLPAAIQPGAQVIVNMTGAQFGLQNIGDMVVLDRANPALIEACPIVEATQNSITLQNVQLNHAANATMDFGMQIVDELALPAKRTTIMTSRIPVARLQSGFGRYGYGRRASQYSGTDIATNLLAYVSAFGGPPMWTQFSVTDVDFNPQNGTMWIPPGLLLAYFSDVRIHYCAGWNFNNVPIDLKGGVASIVRQSIDLPYGASAKMVKAGNATITRFGATLIDDDTRRMLDPYRVKLLA